MVLEHWVPLGRCGGGKDSQGLLQDLLGLWKHEAAWQPLLHTMTPPYVYGWWMDSGWWMGAMVGGWVYGFHRVEAMYEVGHHVECLCQQHIQMMFVSICIV